MAAVGVIATLTVAEGKNADFEAAFSELMAAVSANEPGNEFYAVFQCKDNPQQYKVLERYVDQASLDAHGKSDHFRGRARDRISGRNLARAFRGQYSAEFELKGIDAVLCEQQGPVEVNPVRELRQSEGRPDSQRCREHATDHDFHPHGLRCMGHGYRFGQTAGLVEFDIHHIVKGRKTFHIGAGVAAFVGTERNR